MKVGINYISSIPKEITERLVDKGFIQVLKFPGIRCDEREMQQFLRDLPLKAKADIHGLISFNPSWNAPHIFEDTKRSINQPLFTETGTNHFSTHIGQFAGDGDPLKNFEENLLSMRQLFPGIRFGGENVFSLVGPEGPNYMTLESTSPEFINEMWRKLDFGVFDFSHAMIACKDHGMSFEEYFSKLDKEKVEILHISGGTPKKEFTTNSDNVDLHTPCSLQEFEALIEILPAFPNLKMVISELAYSEQNGKRVPLKVEDYVREAKLLNIAVTQREKKSFRYLFETI